MAHSVVLKSQTRSEVGSRESYWVEVQRIRTTSTGDLHTFETPESHKIQALEEKQALLETININKRKIELDKILNTYVVDEFNNKTIQ